MIIVTQYFIILFNSLDFFSIFCDSYCNVTSAFVLLRKQKIFSLKFAKFFFFFLPKKHVHQLFRYSYSFIYQIKIYIKYINISN